LHFCATAHAVLLFSPFGRSPEHPTTLSNLHLKALNIPEMLTWPIG
jgi:hypothetical protein